MAILILGIFQTTVNSEVINKIVAHVGSRIITEYDVQNLDPEVYKKILGIKEDELRKTQIEQYNNEALDYLIGQEVVAIAAEREGIKVQDAEVDEAITEIMKRNNVPADKLEEYLAKEGMSLAKYKFQLKNDILNARVRSQVLMPKIVVTEQDIRDMANEKKDSYQLYDQYNVRLLLTPDKEAITKAIKAIKGGESFEEAVKKYSIDPSASKGGKMGWIEPDLLSPAMKDAIITTKVGSITKPFEVKGQWAILFIDEFKNKFNFSEEVRKNLTEDAADKIFKQVFNTWLDRNKSTIVIMKAGERFEIR